MVYLILVLSLISLIVVNLYQLKTNRYLRTQYMKYRGLASKNDRLFKMSIKCADRNINDNCIYDYLKNKNYNSIIVYGLHYAGELVINALKDTDIKIVCGIDKSVEDKCYNLKIIHPEDDCPNADAVVVTAVTAFTEIDEFLYHKIDCPIISLEDIVYSKGCKNDI